VFASCPEWRLWVAKAATLGGLASGMVGLFQCYECEVWNAPTRAVMEKVTGLMGNVNFFAAYLLLLVPFCLAGVILLPGIWRWGAVLAAIHSFFLIILLQGRSVWMGAVAVLAVIALAVFVRPKSFGFGAKTRFLIVCAIAFSVFGFVLFFKWSPPENPLASRLRAAFSEDVRLADGGRLMIWRETLQMFADHFPFGVGAGNFTIHLQGYRDGGRLDFSQIDSRWNQPHNDYLWILAEKGVFGFLTFILALILAVSNGVRSIARSQSREESWIATAALAGLAGYLVDSFFSFPLDRVNHQVAMGVILAALATRPTDQKMEGFSRWGFRIPIFAGLAVAILGVGVTIAGVSLKQEYHVALAREAMSRGHWNTMQKHARLARTPLRTLDNYAVPVSFLEGFALMKKGNFGEALPLFESADRENPDRFYILNNLAVLYAARGENPKALELFMRLVRLYPEHAEASCNLALFFLEQGKTNEALRVIEQIPRDKIPFSVLQRFPSLSGVTN
jgi:O-antigen ligase